MANDTSVEGNTAFGFKALGDNTEGGENVAVGTRALEENELGDANTAIGQWALKANKDASGNTAVGAFALPGWSVGGTDTLRQLGNSNSAFGASALLNNETGNGNTAVGFAAMLGKHDLSSGISGNNNVAVGASSLVELTSGSFNTATGVLALNLNSTGSRNTATGVSALSNLATGSRNTALGAAAGKSLTSGSDNIYIGAQNFGNASESAVIRLGVAGSQKKAYVAGIRGVATASSNAVPVFVDINGQLGTIKSARVYKEDIQPLGNISERLMALRPVSFRYKEADADGSNPLQFGLVAEDVAEVFPELVVYDEAGNPETVRYDLIATMLLNEFQRERSATNAELAQLRSDITEMAVIVAKLSRATE